MAASYHQRFKTFQERFWEKVWACKKSSCWEWTGSTNGGRYGKIKRAGKEISAHRASWEIHFGKIPADIHVCHACDNPLCVNPAHLFLGTCADNHLDKVSKGRQSRGAIHGSAKLSNGAVLNIRRYYGAGAVTQKWLADVYGVTQVLVGKIVRREVWRHI